MANYGLDKAQAREITKAFQAVIEKSAETQTVYLRHRTGRAEDPSGRPTAAGTPVVAGPYRARVTEIVEANPYVLQGIGANLGNADFDLFLRGKAMFEFNADLDLETKEEVELCVKVGAEYLIYEPFKLDDKLICNRDLIGEELVTYYVVAKIYGKTDSL